MSLMSPGLPFIQLDICMSPMSQGSRSYIEMSICPLCPWGAVRTVRCVYVPYIPGSRLYSEMSICPLCPRGAVCTVRCPYVPMSPGAVRTVRCPYIPMSLRSRSYSEMSICPYVPWTSRCTNSFGGTRGTYRHLAVRTASWGHMDISLYKRLPAGE